MVFKKTLLHWGCLLPLIFGGYVSAQRPSPAGATSPQERRSAWEAHQELERRSLFRGLPFRSIGPVVQGGRLVDIEVDPQHPYTFYVAYASGGIWKTTNNAVTFVPIFDRQATTVIGDIAVDPRDGRRIWVGTGENNSSRSSYSGAGVFLSEDGGETWKSMGLWGSDRIGRILVDPRNSSRIFVAALGPLYTIGGDRGVYLSDDGGKKWKKILDAGEGAGFVDLHFAPDDPDVIYAASWQRLRRPWNFEEAGEASAIWKSVDGGKTWRRLAGGFPSGAHVGRIGLSVSPSRPKTLYALIDNQAMLPENLWDLGDGAVTPKRLRKMSREDFLEQDIEEIEDFLRAYDLDPALDAAKLREMIKNEEITIADLLAALNDANASLFETDIHGAEVWRSDDAGATWHRTHQEPLRQVVYTYGYYFGQIRVAPDDPDRIYVLGVPLLRSEDGGKTFENINQRGMHGDHQAMSIDSADSQRVIAGNDGGLAMSFDGGSRWLILNSIPVGQFYTVAVDMAEPYNVYGGLQDNGVMKGSSKSRPGVPPLWRRIGGGDGMHVAVDPRDNQTTYLGSQFGYYSRIDPNGSRSPTRPRNSLREPALRYNWNTPIALSSHNPDILYFGANKLYRSMDRGATWEALSPDLSISDERGDVPFGTITTVAESQRRFGLIWVGTDDGAVHVSADGGAHWNRVDSEIPADRWVSRIEASTHETERAYLALSGYRDDDMTAYLFRSDDLGRSWQSISAGLPQEPINVVREDPINPDLIYVGTDRGVYVSFDRGSTWDTLPSGLPNVPVHDMVVHPRERELVVATHGRSIFIIDVLPLQELNASVRSRALHLFPIDPIKAQRSWRARRPLWFRYPEHDPKVTLSAWVRSGGEVQWEILDENERSLRTGTFEAEPGVHAFEWDLLLDPDLAAAAEADKADNFDESDDVPKRQLLPWSEAQRLGRPVYITPGRYRFRMIQGQSESRVDFSVEAPEARKARVPDEPPIRGRRGRSESKK